MKDDAPADLSIRLGQEQFRVPKPRVRGIDLGGGKDPGQVFVLPRAILTRAGSG